MKPLRFDVRDDSRMSRVLIVPHRDSSGRKYLFGAAASTNFIETEVRDVLLRSFGTGVGVFVIALLGLLLLDRKFFRTMHGVEAFVRRVAHGDNGEKLVLTGSSELSSLADELNAMAGAVETREASIRQELKHVFEVMDKSPAFIYAKDEDGRYLEVNQGLVEFVGLPRSEILGRKDEDFLTAEHSDAIRREDLELLATGTPREIEEEIFYKGGHYFFQTTKFLLRDEETGSVRICGISVNVTARKLSEERLRLARKALETVSEGILITDADGVILDTNPAFSEITGFDAEYAIGKRPSIGQSGRHDREFYRKMWEQLTTKGEWEGEIWDRRANGEVYPKWLSISSVRSANGRIMNYIGIFQDISDQKESEETLHRLAFYDPLTSLPNRAFFRERLSHEIGIASRTATKLGVLFIDLDRFKYVNDSLGHSVGDMFLGEVARRLSALIDKGDTVARLGGDEFAIIRLNVNHPLDLQMLAQNILQAISEPFSSEGQDVFLDASIGIVIYPDDATATEHLLRNADMAMYRAKDAGGNQFAFFKSEMTRASARRLTLDSDMREAIYNGEFEVYYQPKIEVASGKVAGMEALVRWNHPTKGLVPPDQFIPLAEETGLIIPIGQWVLETACRQTRLWHDKGLECLRVAVNLSANQFADPLLVETVAGTLETTRLDATSLELEITESVIMKDVDHTAETFHRFADMGIRLAIDDFGTGYSSLSYLKRFPIHSLKIDRSFVMDLETDNDDQAIVHSVGSLAQNLNLAVVAEGVETEFQYDFLKQVHCQFIQGFWFSKPLPAGEFEAFVNKCGTLDAPACFESDESEDV